jgi:FAD/FMN-containing dehydrogenase
MKALEKIHHEVLRGRVFVALHMHAGDGNVHTNIPVNSDNYEMLRQANEAVARIMKFARALGGVISGEHGIGTEKKKYFLELEDPNKVALMRRIKAAFDPNRILNPGTLLD